MNTLHDRFPDSDFGEDAREDHNNSFQSNNLSRYNFNFKMMLCNYIQKHP